MDSLVTRKSTVWSMKLLISVLWTLVNVSSMTIKDQLPSAEFGEKYFRNLTTSTIRNANFTHITQVLIIPEWPAMLIGANNSIYVFNLNNDLDISKAKRLEWIPDSYAKTMCHIKSKEEDDCQNYIKVIAPDSVNGKLVICGTYAQSPSCVNLEVNMSNLENQWAEAMEDDQRKVDGEYMCPFNKDERNTAVFANGTLYTGTVADFNARESVVFRSMGDEDTYPPLFTKQSDSVWLNLPEFIKSYQEGNEVFFFFREISVETQYTGKMYYSRIARVCINDKGHSDLWTTFLKARLDCSFHGEFPFHFNYLQDVTRVVEGDKTFYYGVFTTGDHEIPASAVCKFDLDEIRENFRTSLFKQTTPPWQAVPAADVPGNRPGSCNPESAELSDEELNFIKTHPIMFSPVKNSGQNDPLFSVTRSNYRLQSLVITKKGPYSVIFAGTDNGRIMKIVVRENHGGSKQVSTVLLYVMHVIESNHPITNMRLYKKSNEKEVIYVTSENAVVELQVQHCQYLKNCSCKQDPYCEWIESGSTGSDTGKCIIATDEYNYQDVELNCTDPIEDVESSLVDCTYQGTLPDDITTIVTTPSAASTTTVVVTTTRTPEPPKLGTPYRQTTRLETTLTRPESGNEMRIMEAFDLPTEKLVDTQKPTENPPKPKDDEEAKSDTSKQTSLDDQSKTFIILAIAGWTICFLEMACVVGWCMLRKNKGVVMLRKSSSMEKIKKNVHSTSYSEPPSYGLSPMNTLNRHTPNGKHMPNGKHTPNGRHMPNGKHTPNGKPVLIDTKEIHEVKKRLSQNSCGRNRSGTLDRISTKINIGNGHIPCANYEGFSNNSGGPSPTSSTNEAPPTYSQSFEEDMTSLVLEMEPHIKRISSVEV